MSKVMAEFGDSGRNGRFFFDHLKELLTTAYYGRSIPKWMGSYHVTWLGRVRCDVTGKTSLG